MKCKSKMVASSMEKTSYAKRKTISSKRKMFHRKPMNLGKFITSPPGLNPGHVLETFKPVAIRTKTQDKISARTVVMLQLVFKSL